MLDHAAVTKSATSTIKLKRNAKFSGTVAAWETQIDLQLKRIVWKPAVAKIQQWIFLLNLLLEVNRSSQSILRWRWVIVLYISARTIDTGARAKVDLSENEIQRPLKQCKLGNVTFNLGDKVTDSSDPCEECICTTPPELTCTRTECPTFPDMQGAVCTSRNVPGQCCPILECVSANPPSIDVCQVIRFSFIQYNALQIIWFAK